ncbi:hypothetical protein GCM10023191_078500 [Actinoallomurus oryzae]|uniref:Uncharacterized protein n=1 Tax=Actinoallomurus oryzae TaxID=502180 RepID=A0ABP8QXF6_9ACTN
MDAAPTLPRGQGRPSTERQRRRYPHRHDRADRAPAVIAGGVTVGIATARQMPRAPSAGLPAPAKQRRLRKSAPPGEAPAPTPVTGDIPVTG